MKLKVISTNAKHTISKIAVHVNGKSGFSSGAVEKMGVDKDSYVQIAINEDNPKDDSLYAIVHKEEMEDSIKVNKAGAYFYLRTKTLFDDLNIDYRNRKIVYDVNEIEYEGKKIFKLIRRELGNRKKVK